MECLEPGLKNMEPSRNFAWSDKGQEEGHVVDLPLPLSLTRPVTCPAGPKFLLQIMERYLNSHPTVCAQQLAVFPSI